MYQRVLAGTEYEGQEMHENFGVALWSKFKLNDDLSVCDIKEKIDRKFRTLFSLDKIDMLIWNRMNKTLANNYASMVNMKINFKEDKSKGKEIEIIQESNNEEIETSQVSNQNKKKAKKTESSSSGSD